MIDYQLKVTNHNQIQSLYYKRQELYLPWIEDESMICTAFLDFTWTSPGFQSQIPRLVFDLGFGRMKHAVYAPNKEFHRGKRQPQARKVLLLPVNLSKSSRSISSNVHQCQWLLGYQWLFNSLRYPSTSLNIFHFQKKTKKKIEISRARSSHWGPGTSKEAVQDTLQSTQPPTCMVFLGTMGQKMGKCQGKWPKKTHKKKTTINPESIPWWQWPSSPASIAARKPEESS